MNYYNKIKEELVNNEIKKQVKDYSKNKSDLSTYYNVGKLLVEAQGGEDRNEYGNRLIKEYSRRLTNELGKGYSERNLYNMRLYYIRFHENNILQTLSAKLTWSHINLILSLNLLSKINYYIKVSIEQNLSVRELRTKIKNKEYERLDDKTKIKMINNEENKIDDFIKNPILIRSSYSDNISEKALKQIILEDIPSFLKELGNGFTFIDTEYKIKLGDRYNYIDLLLFNIKYNCYVVVELKVTELKAEYIGQIKKYMNYIDRNVRDINQDNTIGIIICKKDNMYVMEYCSDDRVFRTIYELGV